MKRFYSAATLVFFILAGSFFAGPIFAETCGGAYFVKRGESLSLIADRLYKDAGKWTLIYRRNLDALGEDPDSIHVGQRLDLSCIGGHPAGLTDGTPVEIAQSEPSELVTRAQSRALDSVFEANINIVTAGDYAPFTDQSLPGEGLITEVVHSAMRTGVAARSYRVHWIQDWGSHLDPLMTTTMMDMAFPWYKPDCASDPSAFRCENFHFSDPMFEMLILLFVDTSRPIPFTTDADMHGRTLCRPAGYFTHDLNRADRRWLSDGLVKLEQPATVGDCFALLTEGKVDAVAINEFTGRTAIRSLNLGGRVDVLQSRPLSIEGLHVLVHKDHPDADALLEMVNAGLQTVKDNGEYQNIVDRHMTRIWSAF
ncbi:MAG: transporter substrate-binding domain-containing protein [Paracoccaceae bacterium]